MLNLACIDRSLPGIQQLVANYSRLFSYCVQQVAKALNADMILIANGGLGSAYDELELNRGICEKNGINVRGVVLNKVQKFLSNLEYLVFGYVF